MTDIPVAPVDLGKIERLYSEGIRNHGPAPASVGWRDTASQRLRFEMLLRLIDETAGPGEDFTVNELGCGYGALVDVLAERFGSRVAAFRGTDISADMVET